MSLENVSVHTLLGIIALGQFAAGIFFWYCGIQVKMLRLELVSKRDCEAYRDKARTEANAMHTCVSNCKQDISDITKALKRLSEGDHA